MTLSLFEVEPNRPATASVVWMHGLGATNHDFDDVVGELGFTDVRFVFPQAPSRPVTINGGMVMPAWYDILTFDDPPLREDEPTVREASRLVEEVLRGEMKRGIPSNRIVLMGFSQGGAMALHTGLRFGEPLLGIVALSAYLLLPATLLQERHAANMTTPTLLAHGRFDPVVPFALGKHSCELLKEASQPVDFYSFDMPHSLCLAEIATLRTWLGQRFAS